MAIYMDCETVGFHGFAVLIQWAEDDGPIHLFEVWKEPVHKTLALIEKFVECEGIIGFNLAFDWFHMAKLYTVFSLIPENDKGRHPVDMIDQIALLEPKGRFGPCIKPRNALDLMLHARKGPYQSTMDRKDIRIRRVPTALAHQLAAELEKRVPLPEIYFTKRKDKNQKHWVVKDIEDADGDPIYDFKDIVLSFAPSSALKALAVDALKLPEDKVLLFQNIEVDKAFYPVEYGYAPFALAVGKPGAWNDAWPVMIKYHINHWGYHELAREYAKKDVEYTRGIHVVFGKPPMGDDDSILSCMVPVVRWHGYRVDLDKLRNLKQATLDVKTKVIDGVRWNIPTAPADARKYVEATMSETEKLVASDDGFNVSTGKIILESVAEYKEPCPNCNGDVGKTCEDGQPCKLCGGTAEVPTEAARRALEVLRARQANYEANLYDKFLLAERFHASFNVIGALSSRMSGTDDLNAQGIKSEKAVRSCFPLADDGYVLCAGDYAGFEVTLAEAVYNDPRLRQDLMSGKKIHALFGVNVYKHLTYDQLLATAQTANDLYKKAKSAVFAMFYGGEGFTLKSRLGVDLETAEQAVILFGKQYPGVAISVRRIVNAFTALAQPNGIGSRVEYREPAEYMESMFGFRRYFTLENTIVKALYDLANKPPKEWARLPIKVIRREGREQTGSGAVQSALYGASFGIQSGIIRAARNHEIQSSGATITKHVQRKIWDIQPAGIHKFRVIPMNIHDEIQCPTLPEYVDEVSKIVHETTESFRPKVPLIEMSWGTNLKTWADK